MESGERLAERYELGARISGSEGCEVWRGTDHALGRDVVLKLFPLNGSPREEQRRRFEHEGTVTAGVDHPNIVTLYDRVQNADVLVLVLERVHGQTLAEALGGGTFTPARAVDVAIGICAALTAVHGAGIVHCDIKPNNVMLTADDQVKVLDFSIAGNTGSAGARPAPLAVTPEYAAPEQFDGERRGDDVRFDLYALGGVLFTMLTGQPPFPGLSGQALVREKREGKAPPIESLRQGLPRKLAELINQLLSRDPGRRPASAQEVMQRLIALRASAPFARTLFLDAPTRLLMEGRAPKTNRQRQKIEFAGLPEGAVVAAVSAALLLIISLFTPWTLIPDDSGTTPQRSIGFALAYTHSSGWIYLIVLSSTALIVSPKLPRGVDDVFLLASVYGLGLGVLNPIEKLTAGIPAGVLPHGSVADGGIGFTYAAGLVGLISVVGALGWQVGCWTRQHRAFWFLTLGVLALGEGALALWVTKFEALFTALHTMTVAHQVCVALSGAVACSAVVCCCILPPRSNPVRKPAPARPDTARQGA